MQTVRLKSKTLLNICVILLPQVSMSQTINPGTPVGPVIPIPRNTTYTYDACGNRTSVFSMMFYRNTADGETEDNDDTPMLMKVSQRAATNIIDIKIGNPSGGILSLYDTEGRLWFSKEAEESMSVNLTEYRKGCYILKLELRDKNESWKILKQ